MLDFKNAIWWLFHTRTLSKDISTVDLTANITQCENMLYYNWWFSPGTPVSSTNKTDRHDITEILLKVELSTINLQPYYNCIRISYLILNQYWYFFSDHQSYGRHFWLLFYQWRLLSVVVLRRQRYLWIILYNQSRQEPWMVLLWQLLL